MTIAVGFYDLGGIVLCADSLESDGVTKKRIQKIHTCSIGSEWGYGLVCAGESDLASTFSSKLSETIVSGGFDRDEILLKVRGAISTTRKAYPRGKLALLFALHAKQSLRYPASVCELFRVMDGSEHLAPVNRYQAIGIGAHLSHFLLKNLHQPSMNLENIERLGIFVVSQAIEHVDGCEGPIQAITYRIGEWQWRPVRRPQIEEICAAYTSEELRATLRGYWESKWAKSSPTKRQKLA